MRHLVIHTFATPLAVAVLAFGMTPATAQAAPARAFPGMEIRQGSVLCTLGYVDPTLKLAFTAGHCRGEGAVTDKDGNAIGHIRSFRDNTPSGTVVTTDQQIADYEAIILDNDVVVNNTLPGGRPLQATPGVTVQPGQPVCHFGVITGETCGVVESVNNGWFTMSRGVQSGRGDSGGPVYLASNAGNGQIVGIFNSVWGDLPAAVSWRLVSQQVHEDAGVAEPS